MNVENERIIYQTGIQMKDSVKKPEKKEKTSMPQNITQLIEKMKKAPNYDMVCEALKEAVKNGDIVKRDNITYTSGDYIISDILRHNGERNANMLKELSKKGINISPQYVDSINIEDYTILITKIDGLNGKELIPYTQGKNSVSREDKAKAFDDVKKLAKAGLYNQSLSKEAGAWYVVPGSNKLILPVWNLRPIDNNEASDLMNKCYKTIFD